MIDAHPTLRFGDLKGRRSRRRIFDPSVEIHYTYNGRGAIYQFLRSVADRRRNLVLVPAFHCPTVVEPAIRAGYEVDYYEIDHDLNINKDDLLKKINADVAVLIIINFFGFSTNLDGIRQEGKKFGCLVLEDCSHSFLHANPCRLAGEQGDAATFSFWKLVPSYVGGGVRNNSAHLHFQSADGAVPIRDSIVRSKRLFEQAVNNTGDGFLRSAFNYLESKRVGRRPSPPSTEPALRLSAEEAYPIRAKHFSSRMPWSARRILNTADLEALVETRRSNFLTIHEKLAETNRLRKVFPDLPDNVCPWAYPVILSGRSEIDYRLRGMGVPLFTFGEVLHPNLYAVCRSNDAKVASAEFLSQNLLCLAVHQNLTHDQVSEYCDKINGFLRSLP